MSANKQPQKRQKLQKQSAPRPPPPEEREIPSVFTTPPSPDPSPPAADTTVAAATTPVERRLESPNYTRIRPKNFSNLEDRLLCKAYVQYVTSLPDGTKQRPSVFWNGIEATYNELYDSSDDKPEKKVERNADALMNRYKRHIHPDMVRWMPFYKKVVASRNPSIDTVPSEHELINLACEAWAVLHNGKSFRFRHVIDIVMQLPEFNPSTLDNNDFNNINNIKKKKKKNVEDNDDEDDDDDAYYEAQMGKYDDEDDDDDDDDHEDDDDDHVSGSNKKPVAKKTRVSYPPRPSGQKVAKRLAREKDREASIETNRIRAIERMATAQAKLAKSLEQSNQIDLLHKEFQMQMELGNRDGARKCLQEIREMKEAIKSNETPSIAPSDASSTI
ncbi:hypothetical protein IV203_030541 [Nitzschia inconspicua]|uniref:No apical meristem-associated C-terminal domain-containing protein n=1 Tax=Nitzschia inconspicua TaxID=303405 RepID=A0A9K3Q1S2_9STRA|nr:hypothetical protein IV203_030541 [Nitzschia inconspicua]